VWKSRTAQVKAGTSDALHRLPGGRSNSRRIGIDQNFAGADAVPDRVMRKVTGQ